MLRNPHMKRGASFGNMIIDEDGIKIEDDKLYIHTIYFKREDDSKLNSPYAFFIKNSNKAVRYYNYYIDNLGNFNFKQQQDLVEIMSDYGLTREEAAKYEKIMKDALIDLKEDD